MFSRVEENDVSSDFLNHFFNHRVEKGKKHWFRDSFGSIVELAYLVRGKAPW